MKIVLVTQARIGSSRLPGKVLLKIGEETLLDIHLSRVGRSKKVNEFVLATTNESGTDQLVDIAKKHGFHTYKGSTEDVLDRFYKATGDLQPDWVVRVTSDCPLLDPAVIDEVIEKAISSDCDYCSNTLTEDFPDGQDVEVFKFSALEKAWKDADKKFEREHVTPYIRNHSDRFGGKLFHAVDVSSPVNYNKIRMTVDESADLGMMTWLIGAMGTDKGWMEYTRFMLQNPDKLVNADIIRNEGYLKSLKEEKTDG